MSERTKFNLETSTRPNETVEAMGVKGIIISAVCVAVGMALSLPTKMYLTFLLVKREADKQGSSE
ncbi:hypothetical protein AYI92_05905 [Shewanella xiamenensis]|uniref:hypothetical protein n=1 Tax=Shewanella xiamenensis TaxID=332186 RepID=UPI0011856A71|nr:hypothetical protein [Shewanella xiamenensis]TVL21562.1 hypothetical protein AYI90_06280 [Shewanella xiamenensis]TVL21748.1 hypothetical protein AYI91_07100 [Shewanella xiamenensis]TVL27621.1 hypothetical protein AYI92_05905 [Shewanella xiamenensis]TVL35495.1 hypothetical protein AYI93_06515 [Shewanella xiamenensis]TVP03783.1 hypothetical protein AYI89_06500 [Shewanella xiamenensis]